MPDALASTTLHLQPDIIARLQQLAASTGRPASEIATEALEQYLHQAQSTEFLESARASLQHYDETGLHLTGDEVDAWFIKLEAGEPATLPECHR